MILMGGVRTVVANVAEGPAAWGAAIISAVILIFSIYVEVIKPRLHRKHPCRAHFTIRNPKRSLSGRDISEGDPHFVRKLVLPSHQKEILIELGILPKVGFHLVEIVVGCEGERSKRPRVIEQNFQFIGQGNSYRKEKAKQHDYEDTGSEHYHLKFDEPRNKGSHFVIGLALQTRDPGLYPVSLSFITDNIEGNFEGLEFLVEDDPQTRMICHAPKHGVDCQVSPFDLPDHSDSPQS